MTTAAALALAVAAENVARECRKGKSGEDESDSRYRDGIQGGLFPDNHGKREKESSVSPRRRRKLKYRRNQEDSALISAKENQPTVKTNPEVGDIQNLPLGQAFAAIPHQNRWTALPVELAVYIFSELPANELMNCAATCRAWYEILHDDRFWEFLWRRDMDKWKVYGNTAPVNHQSRRRNALLAWRIFPKLWTGSRNGRNHASGGDGCTETWKAKYVRQFFVNRASDPHEGVLRLAQAIGQRSVPRSTITYVPMFGYLAKKLLYRMMWLSSSPFTVKAWSLHDHPPPKSIRLPYADMFPGRKGVGSSIGFRMQQKTTLALAALSVPPDVEHHHGFARKVHRSFRSADAFFFVVPCRYDAKRYERARFELDLVPRTAKQPILVVALERPSLHLSPLPDQTQYHNTVAETNASAGAAQNAHQAEGNGDAAPPPSTTGNPTHHTDMPAASAAAAAATTSVIPPSGRTLTAAMDGPSTANTETMTNSSVHVVEEKDEPGDYHKQNADYFAPPPEGRYLTSYQIASLLGLQYSQRRWSVWTVSNSVDVVHNLQLVHKGCQWLMKVANKTRL